MRDERSSCLHALGLMWTLPHDRPPRFAEFCFGLFVDTSWAMLDFMATRSCVPWSPAYGPTTMDVGYGLLWRLPPGGAHRDPQTDHIQRLITRSAIVPKHAFWSNPHVKLSIPEPPDNSLSCWARRPDQSSKNQLPTCEFILTCMCLGWTTCFVHITRSYAFGHCRSRISRATWVPFSVFREMWSGINAMPLCFEAQPHSPQCSMRA